MNLYDSKLWMDDIDLIISTLPELDILSNQHVLITGASGLVCSAITDILIRYNETHIEKIQIFVAGRNEQKMKERFSNYCDRDYITFIPFDSTRLDNKFDFDCDYIIHGAANSSPKKIVNEPVETMLGNFLGIKCLLDYAQEKGAKRILYISSSEVYGKRDGKEAARENDYGIVDILVPRSSYSIGKQAAETLCVSYADEFGLDPVIVRPGHIYGPTANSTDDHISSVWAHDVVLGKDIVMKSDGAQIRSYVYCLDCASAILKVLLCGKKGQAYNISNSDSVISIREMAEILCDVGGVNLYTEEASEEEKKGFNPMRNSSLDSSSLTSLGWKGCFDAQTGFSHTVRILKDCILL